MHKMVRFTAVLAAAVGVSVGTNAAPTGRFQSFAGFALWSTTLAEVQQVFGVAPVSKTGDASSAETSVCYRTKGKFVVFYSGEMGGGTQMEGVSIRATPPPDVSCIYPKNPRRLGRLEMDGLRLGMTKAEFARVAPPQVTWTNPNEGSTDTIVPVQEQPSMVAVTTIAARFKAGKAVMFSVSKHEEQ